MSFSCGHSWDKFCEENLLQHGLLSGVCLVSTQGQHIYSHGDLETISQADLSQFITAFRYVSNKSEADIYNKGFSVHYNNKKKVFKIFQKTLSSIYASGENEEECMVVCRLPYGVLICVHQQPMANAKVIDIVEQFSSKLRL